MVRSTPAKQAGQAPSMYRARPASVQKCKSHSQTQFSYLPFFPPRTFAFRNSREKLSHTRTQLRELSAVPVLAVNVTMHRINGTDLGETVYCECASGLWPFFYVNRTTWTGLRTNFQHLRMASRQNRKTLEADRLARFSISNWYFILTLYAARLA